MGKRSSLLSSRAGARGAGAERARLEGRSEDETMATTRRCLRTRHPQNPPGQRDDHAGEYLKQVLDREGIPAQIGADPNRSNVVARLKGNGGSGRS
jgi:hypothetical protein